MRLTCVIVDDSPEFLASAAGLLEAEDMIVTARCLSGGEALRLVVARPPDVVLVDVELGEESGLEVAARIAGVPSAPAVILISSHGRSRLAELPLPHGVVGFVSKDRLDSATIAGLLAARG